MQRFDRRFRVLLKSPKLKDRAFVREGWPETEGLFRSLNLRSGETALFQRWLDGKKGGVWVTMFAKSA